MRHPIANHFPDLPITRPDQCDCANALPLPNERLRGNDAPEWNSGANEMKNPMNRVTRTRNRLEPISTY